ncbi:MAG TPA: hypothetical protein VNM14_09385 [Planctomycetota bacterium]|nr:hypothetical protein [Planctomycetota bacterium]
MANTDESGQVTITPVRDENPSAVLGSLVVLTVDVLVYAGIALHTLLCRRKYGKFIDENDLVDLSLPVQFFMMTPGPIYAAGYLLVVVGLILKECEIERKDVSLKINLFALAVAVCLFVTFLYTVQFHFDAMLG